MQQIVTPRRGGQAVVGGRGRVGGITQKPVRRDRPATAAAKEKSGLRAAIAYLPWLGRLVLVVIVALLLFAGYRAAASADFFQVKSVDITGASRVSPDEIRAIVRRDTAHLGVWNADVAAIRADIEQLPWVRHAAVSRVLPDGLRVRITERVPFAIVHTENGRLVWVDQDAVILGPMSLQRDQLPPFFLRGWDTGWRGQTENRGRLELYQSILTNWQSLGLASRVSELDLTNPKYILVSLNGDHAQVTVKLLTEDYGEGLKRALEKLDAAPNASEVNSVTVLPNRTILDLAQPGTRPAGEPADEPGGAESVSSGNGRVTDDRGADPGAPRSTRAAPAQSTKTNAPLVKPGGETRTRKPSSELAKTSKKPVAGKSTVETRSRRVN